jgi:hypothetical protein
MVFKFFNYAPVGVSSGFMRTFLSLTDVLHGDEQKRKPDELIHDIMKTNTSRKHIFERVTTLYNNSCAP